MGQVFTIERCEVLLEDSNALLVRSPYLSSDLWIPRELIYEDRHAFHRNDDGLPGPLHVHQLPFFPEASDVVVMMGGARPLVTEVRKESFYLGSFGWRKINEWPVWGESVKYREVWRNGRKVWPFPDVMRPEPGMVVEADNGCKREVLFVLYRGGDKNPFGLSAVRYKNLETGKVKTMRYSSWRRWARDGEVVDGD